MPRRYAAGLAALGLVAVLAGCSDDEPRDPQPGANPSESASESPAATTGPDGPSPSDGGAAGEPEVDLLDWQPTGESPDATVVVGRSWRIVVPPGGTHATLSRDGESIRLPAGRGFSIDEVLMSDSHAVVVAQHDGERRPPNVVVADLDSGSRGPLPGPVATPGGSWALHGEELRYPTAQPRPGAPRGSYCLAAVHLPSAESQIEHCAPRGEGFSRVTTSPHGTAMMTFDDARPVSCRTLVVLTDTEPTPVDGVPDCTGWDVVATGTGAVWSTVADEQQVERGDFFATHDGTVTPLGTGATGTLVPCGDSVFFARNAGGGEPARLLRWTPQGHLVTAWEGPGTGPGFLSEPACADDVLTLTLLSEDGDQQVWARVS